MKDLCRWFRTDYESLRVELISLGIIDAQDHGRGNRKRMPATRLKPFFDKWGYPKELTLTLQF